MTYDRTFTLAAISAVSTVAQCGLTAIRAGEITRGYAEIAWDRYHSLCLGDEAVDRYEHIGYVLGTWLGIAYTLIVTAYDKLDAAIEADVQSCLVGSVDGEPETVVYTPLRQVFIRLVKALVYDIYSLFLEVCNALIFTRDLAQLLTSLANA